MKKLSNSFFFFFLFYLIHGFCIFPIRISRFPRKEREDLGLWFPIRGQRTMDTVLNGGWTNIGSIDRAPAARKNLFSRLASKIVIHGSPCICIRWLTGKTEIKTGGWTNIHALIGIKTDDSMIENDVECLPNQGTRENLARFDNRVKHLLTLWRKNGSFFF